MDVKVDSKTVIDMTVHAEDNVLKTHPCEFGEWYGDEICKRADIGSEIEQIGLPDGEYKVTVILERVP